MKQRLLRQMGIGLFTFWFIQSALFVLVHLIPGDPICAVYGEECTRLDSETRAQIRADRGLDRPLYEQYANYFIDLAHFDLGYSYIYRQPVQEILAYRLPRTLRLMAAGMLVAIVVGIPLGIIAAHKEHGVVDYLVLLLSTLFFSIPFFLWAVIAQLLLTQSKYGIALFPVAGYGDGSLSHLALPALVLGLRIAVVIARILRSAMLELQNQDFIRTAHAKGIHPLMIVFRHKLRNALLPVITVMGLITADLMTGALLVEIIFNWPGLGRAFISAIERHDVVVIMGIITYNVLVFILISFIMEILYVLIDPRIRKT